MHSSQPSGISKSEMDDFLNGLAPSLYRKYLEQLLFYTKENIYWLDLDSRITLCNLAQARFFKYNKINDVIGKTSYDLAQRMGWTKEMVDKIRANDLKIIESKEAMQVEEVVINDNKECTYISSKSPIYDKNGSVVGIFGITIDVTTITNKQKLMQIYLDNILKYSRENFYWMDVEGKLELCNDSQARFFGFAKKEDAIGNTIFDMARRMGWDEEIPKEVRRNDLLVMNQRKSHHFEEAAVINGKMINLLSSKSPVYDENNNVIGIFRHHN